MSVVIGIDPGLTSLGWGVLSSSTEDNASTFANGRFHHSDHGVITTKPATELPQRLLEIEQNVAVLFERYNPVILGYEKQFFVKNVTTGLEVAHALGVVLLYCAKHNVPVRGYTPSGVKKALTGSARAKKSVVEKFVCMDLNLASIHPHHAADALAVAILTAHSLSKSDLFFSEVKKRVGQ